MATCKQITQGNLMHIDKFFDDRYAKAGHLEGQDRTVTIKAIQRETVGTTEDVRPVLYFAGPTTKPMVCNKTNAGRIIAMYGSDADAWIGQRITLYPSETEFSGKTVDCIRVRPDLARGAELESVTQRQSIEPAPVEDAASGFWVRIAAATTRAELDAVQSDALGGTLPKELDVIGVMRAVEEKRKILRTLEPEQ